MNKTTIEWCLNPDGSPGYTWNPITGCLNSCEYCYARRLTNGRLKKRYRANTNIAPPVGPISFRILPEHPFYPRFWPERFYLPWSGKPKGIFVCDMGELFGDWLPQSWQTDIFRIIELHSEHRFYLLTKQPQNLAKFSPFPENAWVGVSVTNPIHLAHAINGLALVEAKVKYYSFEPLLERMIGHTEPIHPNHLADIQWVIIGAQTGPGAKPPMIEWVWEIIKAADQAKVHVFLKDNLLKCYPELTPRREVPR